MPGVSCIGPSAGGAETGDSGGDWGLIVSGTRLPGTGIRFSCSRSNSLIVRPSRSFLERSAQMAPDASFRSTQNGINPSARRSVFGTLRTYRMPYPTMRTLIEIEVLSAPFKYKPNILLPRIAMIVQRSAGKLFYRRAGSGWMSKSCLRTPAALIGETTTWVPGNNQRLCRTG